MQAHSSFDLETFNWQPGVYAHASWWRTLSEETPGSVQSSKWFTARLSRVLIAEHRLWAHYLSSVPEGQWFLWDVDAVNTLAFELGIAMYAPHYCAALDRRTVLSFIALLGVSGRERALHYRTHYPCLATWGDAVVEPPMTRRELVDAGGALLTEIVRRHVDLPINRACAARFALRFSFTTEKIDDRVDELILEDADKLIDQVSKLIKPSGEAA